MKEMVIKMSECLKVEEMMEGGERQNRWLTYPLSRLVINPFYKVPTTQNADNEFKFINTPNSINQQVTLSNNTNIPLNIGVCTPLATFKMGAILNDCITMYCSNENFNIVQKVDLTNWIQNEFYGNSGNYNPGEAIQSENGIKLVNDKDKNHKSVSIYKEFVNTVSIDLYKSPILRIKIADNTNRVSIKLRQSGEGFVDGVSVTLAENILGDGIFNFNIIDEVNEIAGWDKPNRAFIIEVTLSGYGEVNIDDMCFIDKKPELKDADQFETSWYPHKLPFSADYGDVMIKGKDYIYDEYCIIRSFLASFIKSNSKIVLCSAYQGEVEFCNNTLLFSRGKLKYGISLNKKIVSLSFYKNQNDMLSDSNKLSHPYEDGFLRFEVEDINSEVSIIIGFSKPEEGNNELQTRIIEVASTAKNSERIEQIAEMYNEYLETVPHPISFKIDKVPNTIGKNNLIADEIAVKESYYKAWLFLYQDILPPSPEIGFNYSQMACGKPSLWGYGDRQCPYTAAWESLIGLQFYSYIDSKLAMDCFKGFMSVVNPETGLIEGESLPAIRGRTAWVIYSNSKDKDFLMECYASIKKSLMWSFENPQWLFGGVPSTVKECDFMWSAMVDLDFTRKIAREIGFADEILYWDKVEKEQLQNCKDWFYETPNSMPFGYYHSDIKRRDRYHDFIEAAGLSVQCLDGDYSISMINGLKVGFNPEKFYCGLTGLKYPNNMLTWNGLILHGEKGMALKFIQASLRDVVLSGSFGEAIKQDSDGRVYCVGVLPSLFNAGLVIDAVLMMNGIRLVNGEPDTIDYDN